MTKKRITDKQMNGRQKKNADVLATLTDEERASINGIDDMIATTVALMERGRNDLWRCISQKYGLPKMFKYVPETGEVLHGD